MPMATYYTSDGQSVSTEDLSALDPTEQLDVMETWFRTLYEDPAERTPYESAEGGYIWIWGGPYDADEVLGDEFGDILDQDLIDSLVHDLNFESSVWAPTERPGDYDDDFTADIADYHPNFLDGLNDIRTLAETPVDDDTGPCLFRLLYVNVGHRSRDVPLRRLHQHRPQRPRPAPQVHRDHAGLQEAEADSFRHIQRSRQG